MRFVSSNICSLSLSENVPYLGSNGPQLLIGEHTLILVITMRKPCVIKICKLSGDIHSVTVYTLQSIVLPEL